MLVQGRRRRRHRAGADRRARPRGARVHRERLGEEGRRSARSSSAPPRDKSSMERAKAAYVATAIAEYFRDQGLRVLLMMDSVTRFARPSARSAWPPASRRRAAVFRRACSRSCRKLHGARGHERQGLDHRALHGAGRGRRHERADRRRDALASSTATSSCRAGCGAPTTIRPSTCWPRPSRVMNAVVTPEHRGGGPAARADGQVRRGGAADQDRRVQARRRTRSPTRRSTRSTRSASSCASAPTSVPTTRRRFSR